MKWWLASLAMLALAPCAYAQEAAPVAPVASAPVAQAAPVAAPAATQAEAAKPAEEAKPAAKAIPKSIFFSEGDMADIRRALANFDISRRGGPIDVDYLTRISEMGKKKGLPSASREKRMYIYPQFYLASIIYNSPEDWIVWLDSQKITPETMRADAAAKAQADAGNAAAAPARKLDVKVLEASPEQVTFEWSPASMERALLTWDPFANKGVKVDMTRGVITFALRPNQTFSSYRMMAMEGKLVPVQIAEEDMQLPSTLLDGEEIDEEELTDEEEDTTNIVETPAAEPPAQ